MVNYSRQTLLRTHPCVGAVLREGVRFEREQGATLSTLFLEYNSPKNDVITKNRNCPSRHHLRQVFRLPAVNSRQIQTQTARCAGCYCRGPRAARTQSGSSRVRSFVSSVKVYVPKMLKSERQNIELPRTLRCNILYTRHTSLTKPGGRNQLTHRVMHPAVRHVPSP